MASLAGLRKGQTLVMTPPATLTAGQLVIMAFAWVVVAVDQRHRGGRQRLTTPGWRPCAGLGSRRAVKAEAVAGELADGCQAGSARLR
jgi:hypothetical protein